MEFAGGSRRKDKERRGFTANIDYATVTTGPALSDAGQATASLGGALVYFPSPLEIGVMVGVLGLGVCLLLVGLRMLPLGAREEK
jgi:molybdopterin-containing oxidoreductase family membrane subunit